MKVQIREILKLNLSYLLIQLLLHGLLYLGLFNLFLKDCFGSLLCNIDVFLTLQVILNAFYLFMTRKKFIHLEYYYQRLLHISLSLLPLFVIGNIFFYLISYKPVKIQILSLFNIVVLIAMFLASIKIEKYSKLSK